MCFLHFASFAEKSNWRLLLLCCFGKWFIVVGFHVFSIRKQLETTFSVRDTWEDIEKIGVEWESRAKMTYFWFKIVRSWHGNKNGSMLVRQQNIRFSIFFLPPGLNSDWYWQSMNSQRLGAEKFYKDLFKKFWKILPIWWKTV